MNMINKPNGKHMHTHTCLHVIHWNSKIFHPSKNMHNFSLEKEKLEKLNNQETLREDQQRSEQLGSHQTDAFNNSSDSVVIVK